VYVYVWVGVGVGVCGSIIYGPSAVGRRRVEIKSNGEEEEERGLSICDFSCLFFFIATKKQRSMKSSVGEESGRKNERSSRKWPKQGSDKKSRFFSRWNKLTSSNQREKDQIWIDPEAPSARKSRAKGAFDPKQAD
jgi:hypothetical protein